MSAATILLDEVSATLTYIGKAAPGSSQSAAVWQIKRLAVAAGVTSILFPDGVDNYNRVWNDRATYSYPLPA